MMWSALNDRDFTLLRRAEEGRGAGNGLGGEGVGDTQQQREDEETYGAGENA